MPSSAIRILIIEDIDQMRSMVEHLLNGVEVMLPSGPRKLKVSGQAKNGWEARLELTRRRPDLILLDEVLPGESSHDLLVEFAAQGIPTILITSLEEANHAVPSLAKSRLVKPGWKSMEEDRPRFLEAITAALGML